MTKTTWLPRDGNQWPGGNCGPGFGEAMRANGNGDARGERRRHGGGHWTVGPEGTSAAAAAT